MSNLISTTIPNLINGVSQQPYALRLSSQCELQENGYSSVVEGLRKRPPTKHRAKITNAPSGEIFTHTINRDRIERYEIIIGGGDLKVYDLATGVEKTVTFPNGKGYLTAVDAPASFRAVTVADYTFVMNKEVTVEQDVTLAPTRNPEALIWIKQGAYGCRFKITINGTVVADYKSPDGSAATQSQFIATEEIARSLVEGNYSARTAAGGETWTQNLTAAGITPGNGWTVERNGSSIRISRATDFSISVTDGQGDSAMKVHKGTIQRFSDLPAKAFDGFTVEVVGDQSSSFDNYYVKHITSGDTASGVWQETVKGGEAIRIKRSTMPHTLVRNGDGTFTFKQAEWEDRKTGDLESNPMPSFVGRKLNDIFFHRNRLGLVADENVIFSGAGDFFDFFRATATQVLDSDVIDVAVSHVKVSILQHAVPFNETLLLFSDQTQFQLGAADLLTPETVSINQTTEFECSLRAKPVGAGRNVYFAVNRGSYTGIREYYVDGDTETNDAADVTSHVPKYVAGNVTKLAVSSNEDVLICLSANERNKVWAYKYYWNDQEKLQSSWSVWTFPETDTILSADFIESELYLVIRRPDGVFFESVSLDPGSADPDMGFAVHLDRRLNETQVTASFNAGTNETTLTLPYNTEEDETYEIVVRAGDALRKAGQLVSFTKTAPNTFKVVGNLTKFYIGRSYTLRYRFSTFVLKEEAVGGGQATVGEGRIQLRKASLTYDRSGYFRVEVTPFRRQTYQYVFAGRVVGSARNVIGEVALEAGRFGFPLMSKNDMVTVDIVNDSYLPSSVLSAEWEGLYVIRSRIV
jgi:hypothetical protein